MWLPLGVHGAGQLGGCLGTLGCVGELGKWHRGEGLVVSALLVLLSCKLPPGQFCLVHLQILLNVGVPVERVRVVGNTAHPRWSPPSPRASSEPPLSAGAGALTCLSLVRLNLWRGFVLKDVPGKVLDKVPGVHLGAAWPCNSSGLLCSLVVSLFSWGGRGVGLVDDLLLPFHM